MLKYYCDVCQKEITDGWYDLMIDYIPNDGGEIENKDMIQLCESCYRELEHYIGLIVSKRRPKPKI